MRDYLLPILITPFIVTIILTMCFIFGQRAESQSILIGDIYLRGEISDSTAVSIGEQIRSLNDRGVNEIVLHITSPGGSVYAGLQIYDYMRLSHAPVRTSCEGYCMSMGAYLLSWGSVRQSDENATIMFHQVGSSEQGKLNELVRAVAETKRLQDVMNDITREHSGMSTNALNEMESYDNFMSAKQAKELNLIDVIK